MATPAWLNSPTTARIGGSFFHVVESPADPWISRMESKATFPGKAILAAGALRDDPGCIEAHLFLARHARDDHMMRGHLEKAVRTGEELWSPVAAAQEGFSWWGVRATRPYMRAIKEYADWHAERGDDVTAGHLYEQLMAMNPNDNQGIRYVLAQLPEAASAPRM